MRRHTPSPGLSSQRISSLADVPAIDVEPKNIDSSMATSTDRHFSDDALKKIAGSLGDPLFIDPFSDGTLYVLYGYVRRLATATSAVIDFAQFKENVTKKSASGFADLLRKALGTKDLTLWRPVVTHGESPWPTSTYLLTAPFSNLRRVLLGDLR